VSKVDNFTSAQFEHQRTIEQQQELILREHELKLKMLDNAINIQSQQIGRVESEVTELKLVVSEMKSSNKILVYIAGIITTAIVSQIVVGWS
jgi:hypothetical protein